MIGEELRARIRRYFYAEHWKIGTIAAELGVHADTVRNAIEASRFQMRDFVRPSLVDPYSAFIRDTLEKHPRLRATRIFQMIQDRGYCGSVVQLRRAVARVRPQVREPFLQLHTFPGEQAQADWAHFGQVQVGRAKRTLSCFVMTLSYSRALYLEFFFDQTMESFLRGHVRAFSAFGGQPRVILYDNLRSVVLERRGNDIRFHPRIVECGGHYHFQPRPCQVRAGNQKGRVERAIRYIRDSFWAGRDFLTLAQCNEQAWKWRDEVAHRRPWPGDPQRTVVQVFEQEERSRLLLPPQHPFPTDHIVTVSSHKTIYVIFDRNRYSIPPQAVGRSLTVAASDRNVRILDGATVLAAHPRSYDSGQEVLDPAHRDAALRFKSKASQSLPAGWLEQAIPEVRALLDLAFTRGESAGHQTKRLYRLVEEYGVPAVREAVSLALTRDTPTAASVAFLLRTRRRTHAVPVDLSRHPEVHSLVVHPHSLASYDKLTEPAPTQSAPSGEPNDEETNSAHPTED